MSKEFHLPANIEAECAVLGAILIDPELMITLELSDSDFFAERNQVIFQAMRSLWDSGAPIDFTLLTDELGQSGKLGEIVMPSDLSTLLDSIPTALYGPHYAGIVKRASIARQYITMAQNLAEMAFHEEDADTIYSWIMEQVSAINSGRTDDKALMLWQESFPLFQKMLDETQQRQQEGVSGFTWPWVSWSNLLGEAQPGMGIHMAGATGTGKTTFAECISEHWAKHGKKVVLVHLELNRKIMLARRMTRHTAIDVRLLLSGNLEQPHRQIMAQADQFMQSWIGNIHYLHAPGWSAERIERELTKLYEQEQCECFVVDYMQKLAASPKQIRQFRNDTYARQADDMEIFKNFAEGNELPMCTLGQLVKDGQDIQFEDLTLSKLRGTQEVADKVNVVALFHRQTLNDGKVDEQGEYIVRPGGLDFTVRTKIDKNTLGEQGTIEQDITPSLFSVFDKELK